MNLINYLNIALASIVIFILIFPFLGVVLSLFFPRKKTKAIEGQTDFACIITAYKNLDMVKPLVYSILKQEYDNLKIYVVADNCKSADLQFTHPLLRVLKPEIPLNSKVRSIRYALKNFVRNHEAVIVFDPDNLAATDCLAELNKYLQNGYKAVQGIRKAKNLDSLYACLDAAGEIYYNYSQRYVAFKLGGSSTIAGSGMAVETSVFKEYLATSDMSLSETSVITDEDKYLQFFLVSKKIKIAFAENAAIFDEKIDSGQQVTRQRARWLNAYFRNVKRSLSLLLMGIKNFNINQVYSALNQVYPPLFLLVTFAVVLAVANLIFLNPVGLFIIGGLFIFVFNFLLVLALGKAPAPVWKSLFGVPMFMFNQFKGLLMMKKANKDFLTTQHKKMMSIEEMELNKNVK